MCFEGCQKCMGRTETSDILDGASLAYSLIIMSIEITIRQWVDRQQEGWHHFKFLHLQEFCQVWRGDDQHRQDWYYLLPICCLPSLLLFGPVILLSVLVPHYTYRPFRSCFLLWLLSSLILALQNFIFLILFWYCFKYDKVKYSN